jgi:hypothetical protein
MPLSQRNPGGEGAAPLALARVAELCASPWALEEYSPLGTHHYLLLDAASTPVADPSLESIVQRLRSLPCPVIALGEVVDGTLLPAVDVVVGNEQEAASLIRNITAQPLAAMTLVQLLRHNEGCTPEQGLLAESLAYASLQGRRPPQQGRTTTGSTDEAPVLVERQGDELHIALNRPEVRNAYSTGMRDALYDALLLLKTDATLRRAVIRGEGSCFSIGGDLGEFGLAPDPATAHAIRSCRSVAGLLLELGGRLEFRLHRACIGAGIELPAFAARVIADRNTFVQLPELRLGLLPGAGGTVSILRRIGRHRTAYLALSGRRVNAPMALEWGLVDELV